MDVDRVFALVLLRGNAVELLQEGLRLWVQTGSRIFRPLCLAFLARLGRPMDIAGPALFLVSDLASWVTGETLEVNGGFYFH